MKPQDLAFQKVLKKIIPDGSIYRTKYKLPYVGQREVQVIMKYSILPTSCFTKLKMGDGSYEDGITLYIQIEELLWKRDFDNEWEKVRSTQNIPSAFRPIFEDNMWEKFRKTIGTKHVEVWFTEPVIEEV
jgi:hypothetical protein